MTEPFGVRLVLQRGENVLGVRWAGKEDHYNLPSGTAMSVQPRETVDRILADLTGLEATSSVAAGRHVIRPEERLRPDPESDGTLPVPYAFAYRVGWREGAEMVHPEGMESAWLPPGDVMLGRDGLTARSVFNRLGLIARPELELEELYRRTRRAYDNPDSPDRMGEVTEALDLAIDELTFLLDIKKAWAVDRILADADAARLHAEILDAFLTVTEGVDGLPSRPGFEAEARAVIAEVDALIPKRKLIVNGVVVSEDVRGDARKLYKQAASRFKETLRAKGSLDEFYVSKGGRAATLRGADVTPEGGGDRHRPK